MHVNHQNPPKYHVMNYGGGSNTSDSGCLFAFEEIDEAQNVPTFLEATAGLTQVTGASPVIETGWYVVRISATTPLLLLDDIFDKLDAQRVEKIVNMVSGDKFGQIFITDTNRDHLDRILSNGNSDYKIFHVSKGKFVEQ